MLGGRCRARSGPCLTLDSRLSTLDSRLSLWKWWRLLGQEIAVKTEADRVPYKKPYRTIYKASWEAGLCGLEAVRVAYKKPYKFIRLLVGHSDGFTRFWRKHPWPPQLLHQKSPPLPTLEPRTLGVLRKKCASGARLFFRSKAERAEAHGFSARGTGASRLRVRSHESQAKRSAQKPAASRPQEPERADLVQEAMDEKGQLCHESGARPRSPRLLVAANAVRRCQCWQ